MKEATSSARHAWQEVWSAREAPALSLSREHDTLAALLEADGFRGPLCNVSPNSWLAFVDSLMRLLDIQPGERVFEIGCGAGALLYPLWQRGVQVGGIDYAPNLLASARRLMPDGDFHYGEARTLPADIEVEHVLSFSVFFYFPDWHYVRNVLHAAFAMASRSVAILDLPNLATREDAEAARRAVLGEKQYRLLYDGLAHLYFDRDKLLQHLARPGWSTDARDQWLDGYTQAQWRFNAWAKRRGEQR